MNKLIVLIIFTLLASTTVGAKSPSTTKKVIKYKKRSTVDLTGTTIQGKTRAPEIFYIFQRKRSKGGKILQVPTNLSYHHQQSINKLKGVFKP
jgi:hypothetical protein